MQMIFDREGDEDEYEQLKVELLDRFAAWADEHAPGVDAFVPATALDYRYNYADGRLGLWSAGELEEFLLWWYPRKVSIDRSDHPGVVPCMRAWLTFLDESKLLDRHSDQLDTLHRALRAIEPQFPAAMSDKSRWGMAKGFMASAVEAGVDLEDDAEVDRFMTAYNEGAAAESLLREAAELVRYRPIQLPLDDVLDAMAARTTIVRGVYALVDWVGDGRPVAESKEIIGSDRAALAGMLAAVGVPAELVDGIYAWGLAVGVVRVRKGKLIPVKKERRLLDRPLELWTRLFDSMFDVVETWIEPSVQGVVRYDIAESLVHLLAEAYSIGGPAKVDDLIDARWQHLREDHGYPPGERASVRADLRTALQVPEMLGAFTISGADRHAELDLTPLGLRSINVWLQAAGISAAVFGDLRWAGAEQLCLQLGDYDPEDVDAEFAIWVETRGVPATVEQLRDLVGTTEMAAARMMAVDLLSRLDPEGLEALVGLAEHPVAGPMVKTQLLIAGRLQRANLSRDELLFGIVDATAAVGEISTDYIVTTFATLGTDQAVAMEELWRVPHPATERVLDAVSTHHPDRKVAKAARKALFKLRSRAR